MEEDLAKNRKKIIKDICEKLTTKEGKNLLTLYETFDERTRKRVKVKSLLETIAGVVLCALAGFGTFKIFTGDIQSGLFCTLTGVLIYLVFYVTIMSDTINDISLDTAILRNDFLLKQVLHTESIFGDDDDDDGSTPEIVMKPTDKAPKIKHNAFHCKKCGMIVESKSVHDFQSCKCGNFTDGGLEYIRRGGNLDDMEDLSDDDSWNKGWEAAKREYKRMKEEEEKNGK